MSAWPAPSPGLAGSATSRRSSAPGSWSALTEANAKLEATLRENAGLHAQLLTQAREAGVLDERQRLAREIHDTLAQGLTGIITQLEAAAARPAPAATARRRHVDQATSWPGRA